MDINMTVVIDLGNSKTYMRTTKSEIVNKDKQQDISEETEQTVPVKTVPVIEEKEEVRDSNEIKKIADDIINLITSGQKEVAAGVKPSKSKKHMPVIEGWEFNTTIKNTLNELKRNQPTINLIQK